MKLFSIRSIILNFPGGYQPGLLSYSWPMHADRGSDQFQWREETFPNEFLLFQLSTWKASYLFRTIHGIVRSSSGSPRANLLGGFKNKLLRIQNIYIEFTSWKRWSSYLEWRNKNICFTFCRFMDDLTGLDILILVSVKRHRHSKTYKICLIPMWISQYTDISQFNGYFTLWLESK